MEPIINTVTNDDLAERLDQLETKMDRISNIMEQAMGAWFFVKLLCSFAIGAAMLSGLLRDWFK